MNVNTIYSISHCKVNPAGPDNDTIHNSLGHSKGVDLLLLVRWKRCCRPTMINNIFLGFSFMAPPPFPRRPSKSGRSMLIYVPLVLDLGMRLDRGLK